MNLYNATKKQTIGEVCMADSFVKRLIGMWGAAPGSSRDGLWLIPCSAVHTVGMFHPLDVVFLDKQRKVLSIHKSVRPFSFGPVCRGAHSAVEAYHSRWDLSKIETGDVLEAVAA